MANETVLPFEFDPVLACTAIITTALIGLAIRKRWKWLLTLTYLGSMFVVLVLAVLAAGQLDMSSTPPDPTHPLNRLAIGIVGSSIALVAWLPSVPAAVASVVQRRPVEPLVSRLRMLVPIWSWAVISSVAFIDESNQQLLLAEGLGVLFFASSVPAIIKPANNAFRVDLAIGITLLLGAGLSMPGMPLYGLWD